MADLIAPFTGYGSNINDSVKFAIRSPEKMKWEGGPKISEHNQLSGDGASFQKHGQSERRISFRVALDNEYDLEYLETLAGRTWETLRYQYGLTRRTGGLAKEHSGVLYLELEETFLSSITEELFFDDGTCEATLSFIRMHVAPMFPPADTLPAFFPEPVLLVTTAVGSGDLITDELREEGREGDGRG
jgi:hypothetical protein